MMQSNLLKSLLLLSVLLALQWGKLPQDCYSQYGGRPEPITTEEICSFISDYGEELVFEGDIAKYAENNTQKLIELATSEMEGFCVPNAIKALVLIKSREAISTYIELLKSSHFFAKNGSIRALAITQDSRAIEPLIDIVNNDERLDVRGTAIKTLAMYDEPRAQEAVISAMNNASESVRISIIQALANIKSKPSLNILINAMQNDEHPYIYRSAIRSIGNFPDEQATIVLLKEYKSQPDIYYKEIIIESIGKQKTSSSLNALLSIYREPRYYTLKDRVLLQLTKYKDKRLIAIANEILNNPRLKGYSKHYAQMILKRNQQ